MTTWGLHHTCHPSVAWRQPSTFPYTCRNYASGVGCTVQCACGCVYQVCRVLCPTCGHCGRVYQKNSSDKPSGAHSQTPSALHTHVTLCTHLHTFHTAKYALSLREGQGEPVHVLGTVTPTGSHAQASSTIRTPTAECMHASIACMLLYEDYVWVSLGNVMKALAKQSKHQWHHPRWRARHIA